MPTVRIAPAYAQNPDGDQRGVRIVLKQGDPLVVMVGQYADVDVENIANFEVAEPHPTADAAAVMPRSDSPHTGRFPPEKVQEVFAQGDPGKDPQTPPANTALQSGTASTENNAATKVESPGRQLETGTVPGQATPAPQPGVSPPPPVQTERIAETPTQTEQRQPAPASQQPAPAPSVQTAKSDPFADLLKKK